MSYSPIRKSRRNTNFIHARIMPELKSLKYWLYFKTSVMLSGHSYADKLQSITTDTIDKTGEIFKMQELQRKCNMK